MRLVVFGSAGVENFVPVVRIWSEDMMVFSNGNEPAPKARSALARHGVPVYEQRVTERVSAAGSLRAVALADGQQIEREAGFVADDPSVQSTSFTGDVGVPTAVNHWGMEVSEAEPEGKTVVPNFYIVGDSRTGFGGLVAAAHEGSACSESIVHEVALEHWRAVESSGSSAANV